ncbi:hypothetical protein NPIL_350571 [Nephila pilipes]|uniref:Uncharacterized protein n=1 Tax=Nephila pilipes TaxID=299642 RepID=A0A8X6KCU8_NEPPI|nr:hypothetical protein NPIL_350571 [Nephila pilipes]
MSRIGFQTFKSLNNIVQAEFEPIEVHICWDSLSLHKQAQFTAEDSHYSLAAFAVEEILHAHVESSIRYYPWSESHYALTIISAFKGFSELSRGQNGC